MPETLSLELIQKTFAGDCDVQLLPVVDSTNDWVLQKVRAGAKLPLACFAEQQTQGRGRRGKTWITPAAATITMSLAWPFELPVRDIGALSLVMGIAVVRALEDAGLGQVQLKWPNDVLVANKKIAGILIETANLAADRCVAVIGVGLNFHLPDTLVEQPDQPWTDIRSQLTTGVDVNRSQLAGSLLRHCVALCQRYPLDRGDLITGFLEKYDAFGNQAVTVSLESGEQLSGVACGVTPDGEIRILIEGKERLFNSAEISLRKNDLEQTVNVDD